MKKILVVFNGTNYPSHVPEFALLLADGGYALLQPVFIQPVHVSEGQYLFPNDLSLSQSSYTKEDEESADLHALEANRRLFTDSCQSKNVDCFSDTKNWVSSEELIEHSKFADFVVSDTKEALEDYSFKQFLASAHCPVFLIHRNFEKPDRVILAYDETPSSIYALKLYSYLFPQWHLLNSALLSINPKLQTENEQHLKQWLSLHFNNLSIHLLKGDLKKELLEFVGEEASQSLIVMGAFGRKGLAALFHNSLSNTLLEETNASLFIAHH